MANEEIINTKDSSKNKIFLLKERFEIDYNCPIHELDTNQADAYKTIDKTMPGRELFALICNNTTPSRMSILPYMRSIEHPNILQMVEYGIVSNLIQNTVNTALIYEKPKGPKVLNIDTKTFNEIKTNAKKQKQILLSLLSAVEALKGYGITHRSIRAENIFFKNNSFDAIVLGDCCACFPAFCQPPVYETIESALAIPQGRGDGSDKNDIYSAAVAMLTILNNNEILKETENENIIKLKLKKGSFNLLTHGIDYSKSLLPVFKGLLEDIAENRWTYIQTHNYLDGKIVSFQPRVEQPKKSLIINGNKCYSPKEIAYNLTQNIQEAFEIIKSGKINEWIKNGLEDEILLVQVNNLIKQELMNKTAPNILVAKVCAYIAPSMPIIVDKIKIFPTGSPKAIFYALKKQTDIHPYIDIFSSELIRLWYAQQISLRSPANVTEFSIYIRKNDIGYGIERIMYDFDEDLPCISPLLGDDVVNTPGRMFRALNKNIKTNSPNVYDNAIIAYLRCKLGKKIEGIIIDLNTNKIEIKNSAILRLYTSLQNKYGPTEVNNLASAMINICIPIIKSYHNLQLQKTMEKELVKSAKTGKLQQILDTIENEELRSKDSLAYNQAVAEAIVLNSEKNRVTTSSNIDEKNAQNIAGKIIMILGLASAVLSLIISLLYWVF